LPASTSATSATSGGGLANIEARRSSALTAAVQPALSFTANDPGVLHGVLDANIVHQALGRQLPLR
jgi:hypothetical protein